MEPERCAECGFDASHLTVADAITSLRTMGRRWRELFKDVPDEILRTRPQTGVWSALEYAAHTRDVIALNGSVFHQVLEGTAGDLPEVTPDEGAPDHGYNALDPEAVLTELGANADRMAARAERVVGEAPWTRSIRVASDEVDAGHVLKHAVHDSSHHLRDVERGLESLGAR